MLLFKIAFSCFAICAAKIVMTATADTPNGVTKKCLNYDDANTDGAWCNRKFRCWGKCHGPWITARDCRLLSLKTDALGNSLTSDFVNPVIATQICDKGWDRGATDTFACYTTTEAYACTGGAVPGTYTNCKGCVPTEGLKML